MGMKSIEERAKEFAQNFEIIPKGMDCEGCDTCTKCKDYRRYIDIVTEQKTIDIEKTCEWLKINWRKYVYRDRDDGILFGHWESDFRKAMEE